MAYSRIKETSTSTSSATISLGGAMSGYLPFSKRHTVGETGIELVIVDGAGNWLEGVYTLTATTTLTRTQILSSSNNDGDVTLAAGTKMVFEVASGRSLRRGLVNPDDVGYDIVLCAGQSNMEGNPPWDQYIDVYDPRLMQFGGSNSDANTYRKIVAGSDPMLMYNGPRTGLIGPSTWFGKAYANSIPSNRRVLLVPVAEGSTGLVANNPPWAPGGYLCELAVTQTNLAYAAAIALYPNSRVVGVIWGQGEQDANYNIPQATYVTALKALIAGFRSRITGAANSWFIINGMVPEKIAANANYAAIDAAHKQVAAEVDRCVFVAGPTGFANDVHYTAPGVRILGTRAGLAVAKVGAAAAAPAPAADTTAPTMSGALTSSSVTQTGFTVTWAAASDDTSVTGYETSIDGGATYTNAGSVLSKAFAGLTAGTVYNVRVRAYDPAGNRSTPLSLAVTTSASADTVAPTMAGSLTTSSVTQTGYTMNWPAASDNVAVTGYETSTDGGTTYSDAGNVTSRAITGATAGTTYQLRVRAYDAAGNRSTALAASVTTAAPVVTAPDAPTIGAATPGDGTVSVAFTAPANTGGAAISSYTATLYKVSDNTAAGSASGASSPIPVAAVNGTAVYAKVKATNSAGTGPESAASNSVTPVVAQVFATWNPADKGANITLSAANLSMAGAAGISGHQSARATIGKSAGKWYWEVTLNAGDTCMAGIGKAAANLASFPGGDANGNGYYYSGMKFTSGSSAPYGAAFVAGDVIGVALDMDAGTVTFSKNGVSQGVAYTGLSGTYFPMCSVNGNNFKWTANFGASAFAYTPPAGHVGLS
jgi:chitodextrinase